MAIATGRALKVERHTLHKGTGRLLRTETAYAVTSCPPRRAALAHLLALWQGHRSIENRLHYIREVAIDEDRATAIGLIHALGATTITATCRRFAAQPLAAFLALGTQPDLE